MAPRPFLLVPMIVAVAWAGCVNSDDTGSAPPLEGSPAQRLLAQALPLELDLTAGVDWWEHIATEFPKHDAYTPQNARLREHLVAEMEALGFDVEVREYDAGPLGAPSPGEPIVVHAVVATKLGTTLPNQRIGLVSHYDTQTATIHGAYDDASGVAAEYNICKALAGVPMQRTLSCIFFDGEEQGLIASREYVEDVVKEGDEGYVYDYVIGYDMTGINWPGHDWKMYIMTGENFVPEMQPLAMDVIHTILEYPEEGVEVLDVHDRNSDERRFKEAGIPIFRFAGGRHAGDYPQYHKPMDTVEYVYDFVGGRANFEKGFHAIIEGSYWLILALDETEDVEQMGSLYN